MSNATEIASLLKSKVPKIDLLMIKDKEAVCVKDEGFIDQGQVLGLETLLSSSAKELCISLGRKGMVWVRRVSKSQFLLIASRQQITAAINGVFAEYDKGGESSKEVNEAKAPSNDRSSGESENESIERIKKRFRKKNDLSKIFSAHQVICNLESGLNSNFIWTRNFQNKKYVALCDTHLQGSFGALVSMHLDTLMDEYALDDELDINDIVDKINTSLNEYNLDYLSEEDDSKKINISIALCIVNEAEGKVYAKSSGLGIILGDEGGIKKHMIANGAQKEAFPIENKTKLLMHSSSLNKFFKGSNQLEGFFSSGKNPSDTFKTAIEDEITKQKEDTVVVTINI